jgi:isopentenyl diphosphate isomerase/L-lactate dehydrogenase-like FMN-dependent dehydrogenase
VDNLPLQLLPKLADLYHESGIHLKQIAVGIDVRMPVAIAPVGLTGMQHADGEILVARAAEKFGIPFTLSTMSVCSIEDIAAHTKAPFWFQLYVMRDRDFIERLIDRAKAATCAVCSHSRSASSRSRAVAGAANCRLTTALASARR